jgi:hypothetical protein
MITISEHNVCDILGKIEDILNEWESSDPKKRWFTISDAELTGDGVPDGHRGSIDIHELSE